MLVFPWLKKSEKNLIISSQPNHIVQKQCIKFDKDLNWPFTVYNYWTYSYFYPLLTDTEREKERDQYRQNERT